MDWQKISIQSMALCGLPWNGSTTMRVTCPHCKGNKTLSITMGEHGLGFNCFRCSAHGNAVQLFAMRRYGLGAEQLDVPKKEQPYLQWKNELLSAIGMDSSISNMEWVEPKRVEQEPLAPLEETDETYRNLLALLSLNSEHEQNLLKRGLRPEDIYQGGYKTYPDATRLMELTKTLHNENLCNVQGVPGFYKQGQKWTMVKHPSAFLIPVCAVPTRHELASGDYHGWGKIQGFQLRFDEGETRYKWLSSANYPNGTKPPAFTHFVGYPERTVWITEGPLKANILHRFTGDAVLAVPGVNSIAQVPEAVEHLKKYGLKAIRLAFDMDILQKEQVMKALKKMKDMLEGLGLRVMLETWNPEYKGIDDFLLSEYQKNNPK